MITDVLSIEQLKSVLIEILFNKTSKVTKISDNSVVSGLLYGMSKIFQKGMKDVAIVESHIFPESATGEYLDDILEREGLPYRFGASASSTYIRVLATPGTVYTEGLKVSSDSGITFETMEEKTIGAAGYDYILVRSISKGSNTNVPPLSINTFSSAPEGHISVTNEYQSIGGRDMESDEDVRNRIRDTYNIFSNSTPEKLLQAAMKYNTDVLRILTAGVNDGGKYLLKVITQNGVLLTDVELSGLQDYLQGYLSITDQPSYITGESNIVVENIDYYPIDVDIRMLVDKTYDTVQVRQEMQQAMENSFDPRTWIPFQKVEWDDLLQIAKSIRGVSYVPDQYFLLNSMNSDIQLLSGQFPRIRSFIVRDLEGNILDDTQIQTLPFFFQNSPDNKLQNLLLSVG